MQRTLGLGNLIESINKTKHYFHKRRELHEPIPIAMAKNSNRSLKEYVPPSNEANNFKLKPSLLSMVHETSYLVHRLRTQICISPCLSNLVILLNVVEKTQPLFDYEFSQFP